MSKVVKTISSPNQDRYPITGERLANGRAMAVRVRNWMERNKTAFKAIYTFCKTLQLKNTGGRIRDRVAVFCVEQQIKVGDDSYTFSNTFWAGISRYLVLCDPSLQDAPIKFNRSDIDCFGLYPISYLKIGENQ